jgi:hypothetical protein
VHPEAGPPPDPGAIRFVDLGTATDYDLSVEHEQTDRNDHFHWLILEELSNTFIHESQKWSDEPRRSETQGPAAFDLTHNGALNERFMRSALNTAKRMRSNWDPPKSPKVRNQLNLARIRIQNGRRTYKAPGDD